MALTHFVFSAVGEQSSGGLVPAMIGDTIQSEGIAPTGSNQQTTGIAPLLGRKVGLRVATDTAVYVAVGENPNATTAAARVYIPANTVEYIMCNAGDKAAVVTA